LGNETARPPALPQTDFQMKHYCFALDLKNDPQLIAQYEAHHRNVWPEILQSIRESGIETLEIFRAGNRLFMTMIVKDGFSLKNKERADAQNEKVQQWEKLMWNYQQALPFANPGQKWVPMEKIFELK
jgi:L-rhamnose mutarotase